MTRTSTEPLFAVALLRIALEVKKGASLEQAAARVSQRMGLDSKAFKRFLDHNLGLLHASARPRLKARAAPVHAPARRTQRG